MSKWVLNFDSAPFCNGGLHLGHVRNYVLGDVRARWLRKRGASCSYRSALDAFGIPNQPRGPEPSMPVGEFVQANAAIIVRQMDRLCLSYDGPLLATSDPDYYRWTQWLFLRLWSHGLVARRRTQVSWCPTCKSTLSGSQVESGRCWRCNEEVTRRNLPVWCVRTGEYDNELRSSIDGLTRWSARARNLLLAAMNGEDGRRAGRSRAGWIVSRTVEWGTPLPAVACNHCGIRPVPECCLPVRLAVHGGDGTAACGDCGSRARVVPLTLDCFFDDAWCHFAAARGWLPGPRNPFECWRDDPPAEVHFHAGFDTYAYLPLYRFIGNFLFRTGYSPRAETVDVYDGHDVVKNDGRKMSKRLGNAPDLDALLQRHGSDAVRLSVVASGNPDKPLEWSIDRIHHARNLLDVASRLSELDANGACRSSLSGKISPAEIRERVFRVCEFVGENRTGAALNELNTATKQLLSGSPNRAPEVADLARELWSYWKLFAPGLQSASRSD